jgi:hypothetical protein
MVAEVCSRFGGYPSSYIQEHTIGQLFLDHRAFLKLVKSEEKALKILKGL